MRIWRKPSRFSLCSCFVAVLKAYHRVAPPCVWTITVVEQMDTHLQQGRCYDTANLRHDSRVKPLQSSAVTPPLVCLPSSWRCLSSKELRGGKPRGCGRNPENQRLKSEASHLTVETLSRGAPAGIFTRWSKTFQCAFRRKSQPGLEIDGSAGVTVKREAPSAGLFTLTLTRP